MLHVYRAANNPLTEELLQNLRKPLGGSHVPKGIQAARAILAAMKRNEFVAMLMDQKLNTGIAVPFFGREAMTTPRSEEHTSELHSLMRISYAVFCLKNNNQLFLDMNTIRSHNARTTNRYTSEQ